MVIEECTWCGDEYEQIEESSPLARVPANLVPNTAYWGADHFVHDTANPKKNYFVSEVAKSARYAIPLIKHVSHIMDWE